MNSLQSRLNRLVANRDKYACKDKEGIAKKHVVPLLGPSAVGKSTIISAAKQRAQLWEITSIDEAGTTGTRAPRQGDPVNYRMGIPHEEAVDLIEQGRPVNWSLMPTGDIYMTLPEDFPAEYNFMACLPDSLPMLKRAGFAAIHAVYIVTPVDAWEDQLASRLYTADTLDLPENQRTYKPDALGRVEEAITSLEYGLGAIALKVSNIPGDSGLAETADRILKVVAKKASLSSGEAALMDEFETNRREMYSRAIDLSWEIRQATEK